MPKRFLTRHPVVLRVQVRTRDGWREGVVFDASRGGCFLQFDSPLPEGSVCQVRVGLPDGTQISPMAEVRRSIPDNAIDPRGPGIGVRFLSMSPKDQQRWESFLPAKGHRVAHADEVPAYGEGGETLDGVLPTAKGVARVDAPKLQPARSEPPAQPPAKIYAGSEHGGVRIKHAEISEVIDPDVRAKIARARAERARAGAPTRRRPWDPRAGPGTPPAPPVSPGPAHKATVEHDGWLVLKYKPASVAKLREFVQRCLKPGSAFIPTRQDTCAGAPLELALRHPERGDKHLVYGRVVRARKGTDGAPHGVSVKFAELGEDELDALERFVGDRDVAELRAERKDFKRSTLQGALRDNPGSALAHAERGWFALLEDRDERAANLAFVEAISLDSNAILAYHGLALSHAFAGKREQALVFARAARKLAQPPVRDRS